MIGDDDCPISTRADSALTAALTAVMVCVSPGAQEMMAIPGNPVILELASAAETAVTSCLASITLIPFFSAPFKIGDRVRD